MNKFADKTLTLILTPNPSLTPTPTLIPTLTLTLTLTLPRFADKTAARTEAIKAGVPNPNPNPKPNPNPNPNKAGLP